MGTRMCKFGTWMIFVLIGLLTHGKCTAIESSWLGKGTFSDEPSGVIRSLVLEDDHIYVGAENGFIDIVGDSSLVFSRDNSILGDGYISNVTLAPNGDIWMTQYGTGIFIYSRYEKVLHKLDIPPKISKFAWSIAVNEKIAVVSLISQLLIYDIETKKISRVKGPGEDRNFNQLYSVEFSEKYGFVISDKDAVYFYDHVTKSFSGVSREVLFPQLKKITYIKLYEEEILVGGVGGVYRWKRVNNELDFIQLAYPKASSRDVDRALRDSDGTLWIAAGGLFQAKPGMTTFELVQIGQPRYSFEQIRTVGDIQETDSGRILVASSQLGLTSINPADMAMDYVHETDFPFRKDIYAIVPIGAGQYLAKTAESWRLFNGESGKLSSLSGGAFDTEPVPLESGLLLDPATCATYEYKNERLQLRAKLEDPNNYCPSIQPLSFKLNNHTYFYYQKSSHAGFITIHNNSLVSYANAPKNVKYVTVNSEDKIILLDNNNVIYESDTRGVWIKHESDSLQGIFVYCLYEDSRSKLLYLCTSGAGLKQFSLVSNTLSEAFPSSGIPRFIRDAHIDKDGNHWLATNKGLMLVNQDFAFVFDSSDGVIDTDFNYQGMLSVDEDKVLIVGDQLSYLIETPKMVKYVTGRRAHQSYAKVVDLQSRTARGKLVNLQSETLSVEFEDAPEELTFAFASSDFHYAHLQHLEYRLAGFHNEWSALPTNYGTITYSGLPYGQYQFEIRVADKKSVAQQPVTSFALTIAMPIWLTWQAICCYIVLALLCIAGIVYLAKRYADEKTRMLAEIIRQKQSSLREINASITELLNKKDKLVRNLVHELRTPVMLLMGPLLDLKQRATNKTEQETLDSLYQQTSRIRSIVEQLSEVERVESISQHQRIEYNLDKSIQYVIESLRSSATAKQQVLSFENRVKQPVLLVEDSLESIAHQLIENAIAYTQEGGFIKVLVTEAESQIHLAVTDNGIGLTPEELQILTERFSEGTNSRGKPHMGIGLNLVSELVLANDGWFEIHSEPSIGTTCTAHIPVERVTSEDTTCTDDQADEPILTEPADLVLEASIAEPEAEYKAGNLPLILIIDSNSAAAEYLTGALSDAFRCYDVHSAKQALAMLPLLKPDIILSDLKIPGMNGIELTREIRLMADFADIPIVLLTAETDLAFKREGFQATVNDYLIKPVERQDLVLRLQNQLAISALAQPKHVPSSKALQEIQSDYVKSILPESPSEKDRAFLLKLLQVVENNYQNDSFSRRDAASALAVSERQLNRTMAKLMPDNFTQFLKRFRLEKSLPMLADGQSVIQIAMEVGFVSAGYFSRCFKTEYGCLPSQMEFSPAGENTKDRQG